MTEVAVFTWRESSATPSTASSTCTKYPVRIHQGMRGRRNDLPDPAVSHSRPPLARATGYFCFSPTLGKNGPLRTDAGDSPRLFVRVHT